MPPKLTQSDILDDRNFLEGVLHRILEYDRRVRYVSVVDSVGTPLASMIRRGIRSLEPPELTMKQQIHSVITVCLAEEFDEYFGATNFILVHREKLQLLFFAVSTNIFVAASMETDFPFQKVSAFVQHIKNALNR